MTLTMDALRVLVITLSFVLSGTLANQPPIIVADPKDLVLGTLEGNTTYLACYITKGHPYPSVTWTKQGSSTVLATTEQLRFERVTLKDAGQYTCRVSNRWGTKENTFTVKVYELHINYGFVGSQSVIRNYQNLSRIMKWYNKLYLPGEPDDPSAVVTTYFRSLTAKPGFQYDIGTGNLLIPATSLDHEGNYTFTVFDFQKTTWSFHSLNVYVKPSAVRMSGLGDYVIESMQEQISCIVDRVRPANVTFRWLLGSSNVLDTHTETTAANSDRTFRVTSNLNHAFLRRDNQETLRCEAIHGVDTLLQSNTQKKVVVYYKYQTKVVEKDSSKPIEGQQKTLQCQVVDQGKPGVTAYKWYKDNRDLVDPGGKFVGLDTQELTIKNLISSDDGSYGCRIENAAGPGIQKSTHTLVVLYAPKLTLTGPASVNTGDANVQIICSVDAKPDFTDLRWFLNDRPLEKPQPDPAVYTIPSVSSTDRGVYTCEVTNEIQTVNKTHTLDVLYGPIGQPTIKPSQLLMQVDSRKNLTCQTDSLTDQGNPTLTEYIWTRGGTPLPNNNKQVLDIIPRLVTDASVYTCAAKNRIGRSSFSQPVFVAVEAPIDIMEGTSHVEYHPVYNNHSFSVIFTVSGGRNLQPSLRNSSNPIAAADFIQNIQNITGVFPYGQTTATQMTYRWKTSGKNLEKCSTVTYFNGDYSFVVSGTVAGVRSTKTKVFRIGVQYPAMWKGTGYQDSSAMKVNKTLLCDVCANPPPSEFLWSFKGSELPGGTLEAREKLHITNVDSTHFGAYSCTVYNVINGQRQEKTFTINLEERGSPHIPANFSVKSRTSETLLLSWSVPFNGGYDLLGFIVEYQAIGNS